MRTRIMLISSACVIALGATLGGAIIQPGTTSPETPRDIGAIELVPVEDRQAVQTQIDALYDVISGPAGDRDWDRFKSLFVEGARLTRVFYRRDGTGGVSSLSTDEFAESSGAYLQTRAFYETELSGRIEIYAGLAHAWSTYESRRELEGEPFERGINSIQLVKAPGGSWKILAVTWDSESSGVEIPARYTK